MSEIDMCDATEITSALAALRRDCDDEGLAVAAALAGDDAASASLAVACEAAPRTRLRVRLELRACGGLDALAALVSATPPRGGALRLAAVLSSDAAGARAFARRGGRRAATRALAGPASDAAARLLAAVVSASESDDEDGAEGLVAYGTCLFRRTLRCRQRSHRDVGFATWPSAVVLASLASHEITAGSKVLELGAGTGLAGLVFAARAKSGSVTLSEVNGACLENLRELVRVNDFGACLVDVERVDFCAPPASLAGGYDAVLAADVVIDAATATGLAETVHAALKVGGVALVVCVESRTRFGSELVRSAFIEAGLVGKVERVVPDALPLLAGASGYAAGMAFDVHRWRKP
jgi:16S rRNA G527 N7-methylase RsmG